MDGSENVITALYGARDATSALFIDAHGVSTSTEQAFLRLTRFARFLSAQGVMAGDRVSLRLRKSLDAVLLAHGAMWLGAIVHPLNAAYTDHEVSSLLDDARPRVLVCDEDEADRFKPIAERSGATLVTLPLAEDALPGPPSITADRPPATAAALLYTSGTTGKPKGALITHENLLHSARSLAALWRLSADDTLLHPLPVFHAHGLLTSINTMLASGGSVLLLPDFNVLQTIAAMQTCTVMMAVPTHYSRVMDEPSFDRRTVGRLRLAISGSAPLPIPLATAFTARTGVPIIERYGSTEAAIVTALPAGTTDRAGWVGWPLPGVDIRVRGRNGIAASQGSGGLEVRGANVFEGYWNNDDATRAAFSDDGWFLTGDVAEIDADGCVRLLGREKEIVITGGLNVYPAEVENALRRFGQVKDAAVFGVPHPDFGEAVVAAIELNDPAGEVNTKLIQSGLRATLAAYKVPKSVLIKQVLPRNSMGKLLKAPLREEHLQLFNQDQ